MNETISAVIMASGHSRRFEGNKLWATVEGVPMIRRVMEAIPRQEISRVAVVSREEAIGTLAESFGFLHCLNPDTEDDPAVTIRLGVAAAAGDSIGCALIVSDQPYLNSEVLGRFCAFFREHPRNICIMSHNGEPGNPVLFPRDCFPELMNLQPFQRGKAVIRSHPDWVLLFEVGDPRVLKDVDYRSDLSEEPR